MLVPAGKAEGGSAPHVLWTWFNQGQPGSWVGSLPIGAPPVPGLDCTGSEMPSRGQNAMTLCPHPWAGHAGWQKSLENRARDPAPAVPFHCGSQEGRHEKQGLFGGGTQRWTLPGRGGKREWREAYPRFCPSITLCPFIVGHKKGWHESWGLLGGGTQGWTLPGKSRPTAALRFAPQHLQLSMVVLLPVEVVDVGLWDWNGISPPQESRC